MMPRVRIGFPQLLLDRIPTLPDLLGLLLSFLPGAGLCGDGLVLAVSEQAEVLRTLATSPLRLALLRAIRGVACIDGYGLGFGAEGGNLQVVHCKRGNITLLQCYCTFWKSHLSY
jgi:hypothetical protein